MDERAYKAGYCWSKDSDDAHARIWVYRDKQVITPPRVVDEFFHSGYKCMLAKWADVKAYSS